MWEREWFRWFRYCRLCWLCRAWWFLCACQGLAQQMSNTREVAGLLCLNTIDAPKWAVITCLHIGQIVTLMNMSTAAVSCDVAAHLGVVAGMIVPAALTSDLDCRCLTLLSAHCLIWLKMKTEASVHLSWSCEVHALFERGAVTLKISWLLLPAIFMLLQGQGTSALLLSTTCCFDRHNRVHALLVAVCMRVRRCVARASKSKHL